MSKTIYNPLEDTYSPQPKPSELEQEGAINDDVLTWDNAQQKYVPKAPTSGGGGGGGLTEAQVRARSFFRC